MDATKNTNEDNSKLQADINATHDSVNKLKAKTQRAFKSTREHFQDKNENRKMEYTQLAKFAATTTKNFKMLKVCNELRSDSINILSDAIT